MMNIDTLKSALLWATLINLAGLVYWFLMFTLAHDFMYRIHNRWFQLSRETFDAIHYAGMIMYKVAILLFFLVPYLALVLTD